MGKIKLLIFDFDGTLVRSKWLYKEAIYKTFKKYRIIKTKKEVERVLGNRLEVLLSMLHIKKNVKILKKEINYYVLKRAGKLQPCPSIASVNKLKDYKKVIVSNSLISYILPLIRREKLKFNEIAGPKMHSKDEILRHFIKRYRISPDEAVYIGDMAMDVRIAKRVGCKSVIISNKCSWSSWAEIEKAKPDFIIANLRELKKTLDKI
jgi:pyrophosphatase PpaX